MCLDTPFAQAGNRRLCCWIRLQREKFRQLQLKILIFRSCQNIGFFHPFDVRVGQIAYCIYWETMGQDVYCLCASTAVASPFLPLCLPKGMNIVATFRPVTWARIVTVCVTFRSGFSSKNLARTDLSDLFLGLAKISFSSSHRT